MKKKKSLYEHADPLTVERGDIQLSSPEFQGDEDDFCIPFYESILEEKPDFAECLMFLGNAYTKRGLYQDGLEVDLRLIGLRPRDPIVHYNLACSYSLLGDVEAAVEALARAKEHGYLDFKHMAEDSDLDNVRDDPRYKQLLSAMRREQQRLRV